ncbi:MAG: sugar ABC transporter ATP-binding protein [Actinobacteria bacterium]|nr:sugar ABC transporter ATP-binding protein [Actinomycetota bacterium]
MSEKLLEAVNISKSFFSNKVLDDINFNIGYGEVLGLVGENGAGKSTLVKILTGVHNPDNGYIMIEGSKVNIKNIGIAKNQGINIGFQELSLTNNLSVAENIFIGKIPSNHIGFVKTKQLYDMADDLIKKFKVGIQAKDKVEKLSIGNKQIVEILKSISSNPKLLILDEPTSSLEELEVENLFKLILELKKNNYSIIYISHNLDEIFRITDRILVLRDGKNIGIFNREEIDKKGLINKIINKEIKEFFASEDKKAKSLEVLLDVNNLSDHENFKNVSFQLNKGEILGFAGLVGSGKVEVCKTIFGLSKKYSGDIFLKGKKIFFKSPVVARRKKISFISEDRKVSGLFLRDSVSNNMISEILKAVSVANFLSNFKVSVIAKKFIDLLKIKIAKTTQNVMFLSGGNQQKIMVSKCLASKPEMIIAVDPTRGIDIGSKADIHEILKEQAKKGVGIILISSELDEVIHMSDRILIFVNGEIIENINSEDFDSQKISLAINKGKDEKENSK